jgi:hypothetical protein
MGPNREGGCGRTDGRTGKRKVDHAKRSSRWMQGFGFGAQACVGLVEGGMGGGGWMDGWVVGKRSRVQTSQRGRATGWDDEMIDGSTEARKQVVVVVVGGGGGGGSGTKLVVDQRRRRRRPRRRRKDRQATSNKQQATSQAASQPERKLGGEGGPKRRSLFGGSALGVLLLGRGGSRCGLALWVIKCGLGESGQPLLFFCSRRSNGGGGRSNE